MSHSTVLSYCIMNTVRFNITLPKKIADDLREIAKPNISKFIAESLEEKIRYEKRMRAIEELKKLPPAFPHIKNAAKYIHNMRQKEDKQRRKKLGQL